MVRLCSALVLVTAALAGGCLPTDFLMPDDATSGAALVPTSPFGTPPPVNTLSISKKTPATDSSIELKVDELGHKLVAANPSLGMKPIFSTIGSPQPEIFHCDTVGVCVTEGLVRQCKTEGQLAAVLSVELGRMVADRETLVSPETRNPEKLPPLILTMGNAGQFSGMEQIQQAEIAKFDGDRHRPSRKFVPPDPQVLARGYLEAAGFDRSELDAVAPLLQEAEKNFILEKQFKGVNTTPAWEPR
jgi:predicted Zn-dependent protease